MQLSIVLLLLSIARQDEGSVLLTQSDIPGLLIDLLRAQQEDDEFVLQILNVFYRMMRHDECRILILDQVSDLDLGSNVFCSFIQLVRLNALKDGLEV